MRNRLKQSLYHTGESSSLFFCKKNWLHCQKSAVTIDRFYFSFDEKYDKIKNMLLWQGLQRRKTR